MTISHIGGSQINNKLYYLPFAAMLKEEEVSEQIICGPDPAPHIEKFQRFAEAGYTHVSVHQVTPEQEGFSVSTSMKSCRSCPGWV